MEIPAWHGIGWDGVAMLEKISVHCETKLLGKSLGGAGIFVWL